MDNFKIIAPLYNCNYLFAHRKALIFCRESINNSFNAFPYFWLTSPLKKSLVNISSGRGWKDISDNWETGNFNCLVNSCSKIHIHFKIKPWVKASRWQTIKCWSKKFAFNLEKCWKIVQIIGIKIRDQPRSTADNERVSLTPQCNTSILTD